MAPDPVWLAGPMLVGGLFSYFLHGASFVQTVYYLQNTPLSRRFAYGIALVATVSLLELAHAIAMTFTIFHVLAVSIPRGNLSFRTPPISLAVAPLTTFLHVFVQGHFALRIRKFSGYSRFGTAIALLIFVLGLIQLAASFAIAYMTANINREVGRLSSQHAQSQARMVWFVHNTVGDIIITISLVYLYVRFKKNTERQKSKGWLNTLIRHSLENGAITSIFATLHIICYVAAPKALVWLGLAYFNTRLYSNVLLASLNATRRIQIEAEGDVSFSLTAPTTEGGTTSATTTRGIETVSRRRHSLSGPSLPSGLSVGTRTETVQFTSIGDSMMSRSRSDFSGVGQNVDEKHGSLEA